MSNESRIPTKRPSIQAIRSEKTKQLLRGLLDRHADANLSATFANLMRSIGSHDLAAVDSLVRDDPLFAHVPLNAEFPENADLFFGGSSLVFSPPTDIRTDHVILRANASADRISLALQGLATITEAIFQLDDDTIIDAIDHYVGTFGHSLTLARKLAFILGYRERDTESWKLAAKAFASYGLNARNYGMMAVADSIGFEFSYLDVKSGFENYADYQRNSSMSQRVSYLSFRPLSLDVSEVLENITSNYQLSLIDVVIYILAHRELGLFQRKVSFDARIEETWASLQDADFGFELYFGNSLNADTRAFRAAPAFIEYRRFRDLRIIMQRLYDTPASRARQHLVDNSWEQHFFAGTDNLRDVLPSKERVCDPLPAVFDRDTAGALTRSCALVRIIENDPDFSGLNREEMGALMGATADIDRLLSDGTIRAAVETARDDFVRLILRTLLRAHSPRTKDSYEFKAIFQRYVERQHDGNVVEFVEAIHALDEAIVPYFIDLLDETMLSQMPFIIRTAENVYETRASLLDWHADHEGGSFARDRAKQLRIDRKIASVRGQINETRLNIDGLRFRQWIDTSKLAEFSGLIRQEAVLLPADVDVRNKKSVAELKLMAHRDPVARAAVAIMDCYREFCTNSNFGVASYLGRRIRHGTLRGALLNELPDPAKYDLTLASRSHYERWLETFKAAIESVLAKLHFSQKANSSRAIISAEIDNREKWERLLICLRTVHDNAQADHGAATIPLTIEQFCWFIFEIELRDIQQAILESRAEFGTYKARPGTEADGVRFERDLNVALTDRFNQVASWFRKPPNISPIAHISDILEVVLRETRAEFPDFNPSTADNLAGDDLELSGAVYYHVYDALSIVIRNAGRYGARPGRLRVEIHIDEREAGEILRLEIFSFVRPGDTGAKAVRRMEDAARLGAANADIVEGRTGMRKLEKMKIDNTLYDYTVGADAATPLKVNVSLSFRLSGFVE